MSCAATSDFSGFFRELVDFLAALGKNNNKAWFDAHCDDYEALYLEPAKDFARAMVGALPAVGKDLRSDPRINGSIERINRDIRFSKDETPYKTALLFVFSGGSGPLKTNPGFFFRISPNGVGFGAGLFAFDPGQLIRYRAAVVDAKRSRSLRAAVDKVCKAGPFELSEPDLKRVPARHDAGHRNADFLRHKRLGIMGEFSHAAALFDDRAVRTSSNGCGSCDRCRPG